MDTRTSAAVFVVSLAVSLTLSGCSTPSAEQVALSPPPPEVAFDLPLELPKPSASVCKLGTSCLELDPRPFEACLVGTRHCVEKATEPVEVQAPQAPEPERPVVVRSR